MRQLSAKIVRRLRNRPLQQFTVALSKSLSRKNLYQFLDDQCGRLPQGSMVLNVGSGGKIGELLDHYAHQNDFHLIALDIDGARGPNIVSDITAVPFPDASFDAVVMSEVLEHVQAPHAAIQNVHRMLKPGGRLILTVPFLFPIHDEPYDYYRYTRFGLHYLLRDFKEVEIRERNSWAEAINVLGARLFTQRDQRAQQVAFFMALYALLMLPLVLLLAKLVPTNFMTTGYVVTARS